ncbi:MAG: type III-B CRISPR module RAMP protein Cmr1 [Campylobacteraceae bacterium]|jgi:CRISPR-associated protein Cmr1|nr:type III-B CRISPR module RAMP protein Cmr1 [Campylobacteraceae bacterium]
MNISRFVNNELIQCEVEFVTPAFLGGADQNAELRTAPFKASLRWWWRVLFGAQHGEKIYEKESELFGSTDSASKVRIEVLGTPAIDKADLAKDNFKGKKQQVEGKSFRIDVIDYLAYGLYARDNVRRGNVYHRNHFAAGSRFKLTVYAPKEHKEEIVACLKALFAFGGVGSRSRNGFGSLRLINDALPNMTTKIDFTQNPKEYPTLNKASKLFETQQFDNWEKALSDVAIAYKSARSALELKHNFEIRGLLSRPIEVRNERITDNIRKDRSPKQFIIHIAKTSDNKYIGRILTLPIIFYEANNRAKYDDMIKKMHTALSKNMNDKTDDISEFLGVAK